MAQAQRIKANSILPARRETLTLETADGLKLVGELACRWTSIRSRRWSASTAADARRDDGRISLPQGGGSFPALAQIAVLRFNTRTSVFRAPAKARSTRLWESNMTWRPRSSTRVHDLPNIWAVGWSFGTDLAIKYAHDPGVVGAILLVAALRFSTDDDLAVWRAGKPLVLIVPEFDDYLRPAEATGSSRRRPQCDVMRFPTASISGWARPRRCSA